MGAILLCITQVFLHHYCGSYNAYEAENWARWAFIWDWEPEVAAPVWVGEFGTSDNDEWWGHVTHLMSSLDMGWAYWTIDGQKTTITSSDTYGILQTDYESIRSKWKLEALKRLMDAPISQSNWTIDRQP